MRISNKSIRGEGKCDSGNESPGKTKKTEKGRRLLRILALIFCAAFLASCEGTFGKAAPKRLPPKKIPAPIPTPTPLPPTAKPPAPRMNAKPSTADVVTPQRQASTRLVDMGIQQLNVEANDRAAGYFMDAVKVDSSNGVAYYYLALANAKLGQQAVARGLLDKAEALLGADDEWRAKINELRGGLDAPIAPEKREAPYVYPNVPF